MDVKPEEVQDLLAFFSKNTYKARDTHPKVHHVMQRCLDLFSLDYTYSVIPNNSGELSTNYPSSLVILEAEKESSEHSCHNGSNSKNVNSKPNRESPSSNGCSFSNGTVSGITGNGSFITLTNFPTLPSTSLTSIQDSSLELPKLKELCARARFARCRARFPIPVIFYNKKHVCRSATLSGGPEIYGRSSLDYFFSGSTDTRAEFETANDDPDASETQSQSDWQLFDRVRSQDIRLLKSFRVQTIVDLMVEKKKVKFGVNVTSSEKVDKENRYSDFDIISLPYPGCEFFKQYRDNGYNGEELVFEWNQGHVDANIFVPSDPSTASLQIDWSHYRSWDLVTLTQNYLKLLLAYLRDDRNTGLLVHCISGWDRTPLFISLLRISLWADGAIHKSLDAIQILYLTIAYDWLLFGHNLEDRFSKGEEILFFCFYFLKYMVDTDFSIDFEEKQPERDTLKPKPTVLSRVRNDSDIHLDGVLLEGEGIHPSPEGSNWSLNSCSSSLSSKSQDQPPSYFQVVQQQDSWDDCLGVHHLMNQNLHLLPQNTQAQNNSHQHPLATSTSPSSIPLNSVHPVNNSHQANGGSGKTNGQTHLSSFQLYQVRNSPNASSSASSCSSANGNACVSSVVGRTSPVAVPVPNPRTVLHSHNRPESNSSASIGSWQLITGTGSLRETTSTSDPSSGSSHSYLSRLPMNAGLECIEASESSCTLVEELTPVELQPTPRPNSPVNGDWKVYDSDQNGFLPKDDNVFFPSGSSSADSIDVVIETPTPEKGSAQPPLSVLYSAAATSQEPPAKSSDNGGSGSGGDNVMSRRRERLHTVRAHFYSLYSKALPVQFRSVNDNGNGSGGMSGGFGSLIGNFATKVGIRGPHRNNV